MRSRRRILIVGSTPLGLFLAARWQKEGHAVTVVGREGAELPAFRALGGVFIEGEALEGSTLRRAGIEETDVIVSATQRDDLNLATAIACHDAFHVERAVAVVRDPHKADVFHDVGVTVVCPTLLAASSILRSVVECEQPVAGADSAPTRDDGVN